MENQLQVLGGGGLAVNNTAAFEAIEKFTKIINQAPDPKSISKTPDGNAETLGISQIECSLDEVYLRQWGTRNVSIMQIANEILMHLELWVIDPQTGKEITRTGCAAVQITVDAAPAEFQWKQGDNPTVTAQKKKDKNAWALDMQNKKPNACYLSFPKLKSLAIKNAAQTLGKIFGRDLNRKIEDTPGEFWSDLINDTERLSEAKKAIQEAKTKEDFDMIWDVYGELQGNEEFQKEFMYWKRKNIKP